MNEFFYFLSLIEKPGGEKNQNKGNNGTKNAKCKILMKTLSDIDYLSATVVSNRELRRALKRLKCGSLVRVIMGSDKDNFRFLSNTPIVHVSDIQLINFYETD